MSRLHHQKGAVMIWRWLRIEGQCEDGSFRRAARRSAAVGFAWLMLADIAAAQSPVPARPDTPARAADSGHLRGGWYPWDPYQYRDYWRGVPILTGFDVEIQRALAR